MSSLILQPELLATDVAENQVTLELRIPEALHYFKGHFTDAPVLPGVVQSHWAIERMAEHFGVDPVAFEAFSNLKFQLMIRPNFQVTLVLKKLSDTKFSFSYSSDIGQHASGKVLFH